MRNLVYSRNRSAVNTLLALLLISFLLPACKPGTESTSEGPQQVTMMLDWVPNTNHTGLFVAQSNGYFSDSGLEVEIIQPGEVYPEQAVASGVAEFGISFQEQVTLARAEDAPLVSIAAIIQHNTSGFASRAELGATSPADWAGLNYGAFGGPAEEPTLEVLMQCDKGQFGDLKIIDIGFSDPLALLAEGRIDLAWIFFGWQGIQAQQQGVDLNTVMMADWFDCIPDYYTPVLITSESMIKDQPETVAAFVGAVAKGYAYAIENPDAAANILVEAVPELDAELVRASQEWLSPRYQANAPQWGFQRPDVWQGYADWMTEHGILDQTIDMQEAFTNGFLP